MKKINDIFKGDGTEKAPFQITSRKDLYALSQLVNEGESFADSNFKVMNDIDMGEKDAGSFTPIGTEKKPFRGHFDGNNRTIRNLYINLPNQDFVGLFGATENGSIKNLGLVKVDISGKNHVGGLTGEDYGSVLNCSAVGTVSGQNHVGGLVGVNGGDVTNCYAVGSVSGSFDVGGLTGYSGMNSAVSNCYAAGTVSGKKYVGGLIGLDYGSVSNCYSSGKVSENGLNSIYVEDKEQRFRPYNADELKHIVGKVVVNSDGGNAHMITDTSKTHCAVFAGELITTDELLESFTFIDGTKCGVAEHIRPLLV